MLDTSARLLRLLTLLQVRPHWATADLADRLGVAPRTVRRDVGRLRQLGYPVHATPGVAGGYRLGSGARLPPLLLDDAEAVAVAVALRAAAGGTVAGIEEPCLSALTKLEQVLPTRLRHRVATVPAYTVTTPPGGPRADPDVLATLAAACRDSVRLRVDYRTHDGRADLRTVEPHRLVHTGRRWYLVAWDVDRADWRTFRVDRLRPRTPAGPRVPPREPPTDAATLVTRGVADALWRYRARVRVHAPATAVADRVPPTWPVIAGDGTSCVLDAGADDPRRLAVYLAALDAEVEVPADAPELAAELRALALRCHRAANQTSAANQTGAANRASAANQSGAGAAGQAGRRTGRSPSTGSPASGSIPSR
ncbi:Predicted DNA-binding transcriptional regulator YafY, contains an HTH and WYL domains [Amycolatopsis arida]|uniref:Predicted DNA-binding transcriptional regulator YafY, contains an HTH and WYL domains n=1 Tax=Amycolatopsis arida TaxID=587909 RepID=A0A1I5YE79_9PSEU|nr:WYL domain-containing protein [Amycolatopsis arida]TDX90447.1 putative DNA-binding transcriptional regulator YafY [Amycolatopsis arida]SFQ42420.1 Predicted DNA-binding transcriptional regulator YafY, contains an HTH and WYL domains [Amycolatopsis arida]